MPALRGNGWRLPAEWAFCRRSRPRQLQFRQVQHDAPSKTSESVPWSWPGFQLGMRLALPVLPGMIAFGLAVGATAARKGFSFIDNLVMNVVVYAGMSQLVAME